jgi:hypothetical protein
MTLQTSTSTTDKHSWKTKTTLLIAAIGILLCSVVTLTPASKEDFLGLLIGTILGWIPYVVSFFVSTQLNPVSKQSLSGGVFIYLVIDLVVRYEALHRPASSTSGIAVLMVLMASLIIIPAGAGLTYLVLALRK